MANITTQTIRVDLSTDKVIPSAFTHQNDTARTLEFSIYNKGVPYTMTGNTVKFAYKSPIVDGAYTVITGSGMASGTVSGNKVTVTLPSAYTAISGVGMLTMIITPTSGTVRPVNIRLVVQRSADGANEIAGASDFPATLEEIADERFTELLYDIYPDVLPITGLSEYVYSESLTWEQGNINSSGVDASSSIRIRTGSFDADAVGMISAQDGYKVQCAYFTRGNAFISKGEFKSRIKHSEFPSNAEYIRLVACKATDTDTIAPTDGSHIDVYSTSIIDGMKTEFASDLAAVDELKALRNYTDEASLSWVQGNINQLGEEKSSSVCIRSAAIPVDEFGVAVCEYGYYVQYAAYDADNIFMNKGEYASEIYKEDLPSGCAFVRFVARDIVETNAIVPSDGSNISVYYDTLDAKIEEVIDETVPVIPVNLSEIVNIPPIVSFVDDDCRDDVYSTLFPLIQSANLPYTLACPPGNLGRENYMTVSQVKEMYDDGVCISCHHKNEYNMDEFSSAEAYDANLTECEQLFEQYGIEDVITVCYPQGVYVDEYMDVVKKHFKMGFTVNRGTNAVPLETYFIKRCELFPTSGSYTLDDAKGYVDNLLTSGGWLIFMTHAWYDTFDIDKLSEMVSYIRNKGIEIATVNDVLERYGNKVDIGLLAKPISDMYDPFFVVDCLGQVWANAVHFSERAEFKKQKLNVLYHTNYLLKTSGNLVNNSNPHYIISDKINVSAGERYVIDGASARYANAIYVVYDSSDNVLAYRASPNTEQGEIVSNLEITMPSGASYFRMAVNLDLEYKMFAAYKIVS